MGLVVHGPFLNGFNAVTCCRARHAHTAELSAFAINNVKAVGKIVIWTQSLLAHVGLDIKVEMATWFSVDVFFGGTAVGGADGTDFAGSAEWIVIRNYLGV